MKYVDYTASATHISAAREAYPESPLAFLIRLHAVPRVATPPRPEYWVSRVLPVEAYRRRADQCQQMCRQPPQPGASLLLLRDRLVATDDFLNDEVQKFLRKLRIQFRVFTKRT